MCDYSLHHVANRPAKIEDKLVTTKFNNSITRGFAAVGQPNLAVCLLPGTEIAFDENVECEPSFGVGILRKIGQRLARFRQVNSRRTGGSSDAIVRRPACDGAATTCRHACRDHGGRGRRATASRILAFAVIAEARRR
jgi:hypothetical protein